MTVILSIIFNHKTLNSRVNKQKPVGQLETKEKKFVNHHEQA